MLKRNNRLVQRLHYLDDGRVSEGLVQDVHLTAELQSVDYEVLLSGGDLHQTGDAQKAPVGVMLQWTTGPSVTVALPCR